MRGEVKHVCVCVEREEVQEGELAWAEELNLQFLDYRLSLRSNISASDLWDVRFCQVRDRTEKPFL